MRGYLGFVPHKKLKCLKEKPKLWGKDTFGKLEYIINLSEEAPEHLEMKKE